MELQTVTHVSKVLGVSAQMLRYYERSGLVESLRKEGYAYRVYDENNMKRLQQIIILRKLQIPLKQIKAILSNQDAAQVVDVFEKNIREIDEQITALSTIRSILKRFVDGLRSEANVHLKLELLNDKSLFALMDVLSFSENKLKKKVSVEELNHADEALRKADEKKPALILFQQRMDKFLFIGVEQVCPPHDNFGPVWDNYFKIAGQAGLNEYSHIVWRYKNGVQNYFVGTVVNQIDEIPENCNTAIFPACDYLVVTHEWLPEDGDLYANGIMLTQNYCGIGQTHYPRTGFQMPDGYTRFDGSDSPITQIEIDRRSEFGMRYERWIPIRKTS